MIACFPFCYGIMSLMKTKNDQQPYNQTKATSTAASKANGKWFKLDNAAIIVPCSAHGFDTRVFRIVCELKEDVDPVLLQQALEETVDEFPHFNSALRKGLFWYYLDGLDETAVVTEDNAPPLAPLYFPGLRNLLYRITYHGTRINLEMFHVLADGTGAFVFFRKMITRYLSLVHHVDVTDAASDSSSSTEKTTDAFAHYYQKMKSSQLKQMTSVKAYQLRGEMDDNQRNHLVEGIISAKAFVDMAHQYKTTVGILLTSIYIAAVIDGMTVRDRKRPVVISVPVNLRQFFPSDTARNFFGVINITYDARDFDGSLDSIIDKVKQSFGDQLTPDKVAATMNSYTKIVGNYIVKVLPLFIKEPGLTYFLSRAHSGVTATLSNLERIRMAPEIEDYIDHFAAFMTAPATQVTIATYKDKLCIGSAGGYVNHDVMLRFYRRLTAMGLSVELSTNDYDAMPVN